MHEVIRFFACYCSTTVNHVTDVHADAVFAPLYLCADCWATVAGWKNLNNLTQHPQTALKCWKTDKNFSKSQLLP